MKSKKYTHAFCCFLVTLKLKITKTCLYNFDPLKPHFYIVKLWFRGVYIIFLISAKNHRLWVLVRTASFRAEIRKLSEFLSENFLFFLEVKFSRYLNRRVFVMKKSIYKYFVMCARLCRQSNKLEAKSDRDL